MGCGLTMMFNKEKYKTIVTFFSRALSLPKQRRGNSLSIIIEVHKNYFGKSG